MYTPGEKINGTNVNYGGSGIYGFPPVELTADQKRKKAEEWAAFNKRFAAAEEKFKQQEAAAL